MSKEHNVTGDQTEAKRKTSWEVLTSPITIISTVISTVAAALIGFFIWNQNQQSLYQAQQKDLCEARISQLREQLESQKLEFDKAKESLKAYAEQEKIREQQRAGESSGDKKAQEGIESSPGRPQVTILKNQTANLFQDLSITEVNP